MSLDDEIEYIFDENPDFKKYRSNKEVRDIIYGRLAKKYDDKNFLVKGAKFLDYTKFFANLIKLPIDAVFGHIPILGDVIAYPIRGMVNLAEMAVELPYMGYYMFSTRGKHLKPYAGWLARAALQYMPSIPGTIGDVAGLIPLYQRGVRGYLRKETAQEVRGYLKAVKEGKVVPITKARRKKGTPLEELLTEKKAA